MNKEISLGKRLSRIAELITQSNEYNEIWDCCCDHGYLGAYLLNHYAEMPNKIIHINFVDQVSHITQNLEQKLSRSHFSNYSIHTKDAGQLTLNNRSQHCIVVAGVTTTGTLKILQAILNNSPSICLDFILCPTRGQYDLRQFLIQQNAHLLNETLIKENQRFYEVLHVRLNAKLPAQRIKCISAIGEFWQYDDAEHISYLNARILHYQKQTLNKEVLSKAAQQYSDMLCHIQTRI